VLATTDCGFEQDVTPSRFSVKNSFLQYGQSTNPITRAKFRPVWSDWSRVVLKSPQEKASGEAIRREPAIDLGKSRSIPLKISMLPT
jgi:hypothetical protein